VEIEKEKSFEADGDVVNLSDISEKSPVKEFTVLFLKE
jgi:hypothetical protein